MSTSTLSILDAYHVSELNLNLLAVGQICEVGFNIKFSSPLVVLSMILVQKQPTKDLCSRIHKCFFFSLYHPTQVLCRRIHGNLDGEASWLAQTPSCFPWRNHYAGTHEFDKGALCASMMIALFAATKCSHDLDQ